jgi:C_GCAxxG_C_C family probable redox protein
MNKPEKAVQYFTEGFNCSQSVFAAIAETHGFKKEAALKIASGFGGGIARLQKTCGAVTGAVMAIGYLHGNTQPDSAAEKEKTYTLIKEFINRFSKKHKSIECNALLGHSLETPEDRLKAKELGLFDTICRNCVKDAVQIFEELHRA